MLRIRKELMAMVPRIFALLEKIEVHDKPLADQGKRALPSVLLNEAEGEYSRGKNKAARFDSARSSASELLTILEYAAMVRCIGPVDADIIDVLDKSIASLTKLRWQ